MTAPKKSVASILTLTALIASTSFGQGSEPLLPRGVTGARPPTADELTKLREHKVRKVKPSKLAIERKNKELRREGRPEIDPNDAARPEDEIQTETGIGAAILSDEFTASAVTTLPAAVDNSTLPAFPPIGSQGNQLSCIAFSTTYYAFSHETCLVRGCDNKTPSATTFSPRWTYNMINGGVDNGSNFFDAFNLLAKHGAVSTTSLPYSPTDFRSWALDPAQWRSAIAYRGNPVQTILGLNTQTGRDAAKQLLANGHVLVVGTYADSWVISTLKSDPSAPTSFAGQAVVTHVNGTLGGHGMVIVGYDDNVWTDLNNNNVVDAGEKGAFKVANSWGVNWGNSGYLWFSYDSIAATSAVSGGPNTSTRVLGFFNGDAYLITAKASYAPKILAEVTLNTTTRNQMSIKLGTSAVGASSPATVWTPFALINKGGAFAFDGTTTAVDGTFVLDFSDLVPSGASTYDYHVVVADNAAGSATILKSYRINDVMRGTTLATSAPLPYSIDSASKSAVIGYTYSDGNLPPVAMISASTAWNGSALVASFDGTRSYDSDGTVASYSWSFGDGSPAVSGSQVSYSYTKPGTFTAILKVTDDKGATGTTQQSITVPDLLAPTAPANLKATLQVISRKKPPVANLTWTAASDNSGAVTYQVFRGGVKIGTSSSVTYTDSSIVTTGTYTYTVKAIDAAGNVSPVSNSVSVTY